MHEAHAQTMGFGVSERERIRKALRRYMGEQRIGTPTLRSRIIEADKPRHREIPLSTLQRFLAGSHQTSEHHVALCHGFASVLSYYNEGREVAQFGDALSSFYQLRWLEPQQSVQPGPERLCGRYRAYTSENRGDIRVHDPVEDVLVVSYADLTFSRDGNAPYLRARESITNINLDRPVNLDHPISQAQTKVSYTYEGVLLAFGGALRLLLRNILTRQPRTYELVESAQGVLQGHAQELCLLFDAETPVVITEMRSRLRPMEGL